MQVSYYILDIAVISVGTFLVSNSFRDFCWDYHRCYIVERKRDSNVVYDVPAVCEYSVELIRIVDALERACKTRCSREETLEP